MWIHREKKNDCNENRDNIMKTIMMIILRKFRIINKNQMNEIIW